jgi:hypothetical protein
MQLSPLSVGFVIVVELVIGIFSVFRSVILALRNALEDDGVSWDIFMALEDACVLTIAGDGGDILTPPLFKSPPPTIVDFLACFSRCHPFRSVFVAFDLCPALPPGNSSLMPLFFDDASGEVGLNKGTPLRRVDRFVGVGGILEKLLCRQKEMKYDASII